MIQKEIVVLALVLQTNMETCLCYRTTTKELLVQYLLLSPLDQIFPAKMAYTLKLLNISIMVKCKFVISTQCIESFLFMIQSLYSCSVANRTQKIIINKTSGFSCCKFLNIRKTSPVGLRDATLHLLTLLSLEILSLVCL